jgi:hypothetical protein
LKLSSTTFQEEKEKEQTTIFIITLLKESIKSIQLLFVE